MCNVRVVVSLGNYIKQLVKVRLNILGVVSLREYNTCISKSSSLERR